MDPITRPEILDEAKRIVCGERESQYGSPENNFNIAAELFSAYLRGRYNIQITLNALDTSMLLALLKISRIAGGRIKADNFIDLAGYAACGGEIALQPNIFSNDSNTTGLDKARFYTPTAQN